MFVSLCICAFVRLGSHWGNETYPNDLPHPMTFPNDLPHPMTFPNDLPHPMTFPNDLPHPMTFPNDLPHPMTFPNDLPQWPAPPNDLPQWPAPMISPRQIFTPQSEAGFRNLHVSIWRNLVFMNLFCHYTRCSEKLRKLAISVQGWVFKMMDAEVPHCLRLCSPLNICD